MGCNLNWSDMKQAPNESMEFSLNGMEIQWIQGIW